MRSSASILAGVLAGAAVLTSGFAPPEANAGGLFTADRGVRPLGRGGAFVAGADDLGAIWYNPAGIADAGTTLFIDLAWMNFSSEYTRRTNVTDNAGTVRRYDYGRVDGTTPFLPIPTLGGTYNFGSEKQFTLGFGILAPMASIASYPLTVNGQPSPSRYSLVSLDGSALVVAGAYFAYKPSPKLRIGAGLQALVGKFASRVVFSASPADRVISSPEDPQYDALAQLDVGPIIAPSGNLGIIYEPEKHVRFGLSGQLPFFINAPATIKVRLPTAAVFDNARQEGEDARVKFKLPPIIRGGVELRTDLGDGDWIRVEAAYEREFWSMHESIDIRTEDVKLYGVTGFPSPFGVAPISLPRHFQDSNSFRLGGEYSTKSIFGTNRTELRAGISYETSAIPDEWVSPLTYDANKFMGAVGGSLHAGDHWRLDAVAALVLLGATTVAPEAARVPRVNPVQGNPTATEAINGGDYSARAVILGVGAQYTF
ncbi:MAG: rane protein involved in aromatic hydrocarbon degradation [Labilithrix sp.]|nr:rane protein involved in aromatic hydrocarbon degradation [Labilithrix sp.]